MSMALRLLLACGIAAAFGCLPGCSKSDGDGGSSDVLAAAEVPVSGSAVWVDYSLKDGKAEWHPFRDPGNKPPVDEKSAKSANNKGTAAAGAEAGNGAEKEIRAMIEAYNNLVAEGKSDDALEFWVEPQHETVKKVNTALAKAVEELKTVREELTKKLPDATDRVAKAMSFMDDGLDQRVKVDSIKVTGEKEAEGFDARQPGQPTLLFKQIEEDWYLQVPDVLVPVYEGMAEKLPTMVSAIGAALQSGTPPEQVLQQFETLGSMFGGAAKPEGEAKPEGS